MAVEAESVIKPGEMPSKNTEPPRGCSCHPYDRPTVCQKQHALSACKAELTLTVHATVLEWVSANPDTAAALAAGTMVALSAEELANAVQPYRETPSGEGLGGK